MKVIVITQEDSFVVPRNIEKIIRLQGVKLIKIIDIDSESSLVNKKSYFIKGFGLLQTFKMGLKVIEAKIINLLDFITMYKLNIQPRSLSAVARRYNVDFQRVKNVNSEAFLKEIEKIAPDLIVSYSAPVVFKKDLLRLPKHGCVNLHCSYLPHYAGVMPSFWTLYNKEKETGATVHYMDTKIDNGGIINQAKILIDDNETMFSLIKKSKEIGGNLMCKTILEIQNSTINIKENDILKGSYYSWPSIQDFQAFTKQGGRLI